MKQKYFSSKSEKRLIPLKRNSFKQAIKKIEFNTFKQDFQRRQQISLKSKLRELWLQRINIIPPNITPAERQQIFRSTDSFSHKESDYFNMFKHNCYRKDWQQDMDLLFQKKSLQIETSFNQILRENSLGRQSYKQGGESPQNRLQAFRKRKFKENWKVISRRDELNILRFSTSTPKEKILNKTPQKNQFLIQPESPVEKEPKSRDMMYIKMVEGQESPLPIEQSDLFLEKKTEKNFRLKPLKNKTSLVIKQEESF